MRAWNTVGDIFNGGSRTSRTSRSVTALAAVLLTGLALSGCSGDNNGLADQFQGSADKNYVAGDGSTTSFAIADRGDPVVFEGIDEYGETFGSQQTAGHVTVVNFWYAGCAPCRAEAGDLVEVYHEFESAGVKFVGVNTRDQSAQAVQFAKEFAVPYPSIMDTAGGREVQRAFASQVPLNAVPTTLVLDAEGKVAHRVIGQLAAASQLSTLVKETLAEG